VALEGGIAHQEVPAHEPGNLLGLLAGQAKTRAKLQRDLLAEHRMIAAATFGDVVQEDGKIEGPAGYYRPDDSSRQRMLVLELAFLDAREDADGKQRVLVDCMHVIHVILHLRDDAAEIGNEAAENTSLVHAAKRDFGVLARSQDFEEQTVR